MKTEGAFTKVTVTKGVKSAIDDLILRARLNDSVVQVVEDFLVEAVDACLSPVAPAASLPSILKIRGRLKLPLFRYADTVSSYELDRPDTARGSPPKHGAG